MTFWEYSFRDFALGYSDRFGFSNITALEKDSNKNNDHSYKSLYYPSDKRNTDYIKLFKIYLGEVPVV